MILCVGEILVDMIGCERDGAFCYERKAGGAPFNVACAVKRLGGSSAFAGSVGDDLIGEFLIDFAESRGLDGLCIATEKEHNTTLAFVEIDGSGERSFCFYRKSTADYRLPHIDDALFDKAGIIHIGSLMLSEEVGRAYADKLAERAKRAGKTVSFDVNYRTDIFRDVQSAIALYKKYIELADIVKLSEDEYEIFGAKYIDGLKDKLICITLGSRGSKWKFGARSGSAGTISVKPVDTTGAGDAFYAGLLKKLDGVDKSEYTDEFLNGALLYANVCGALNTLGHGAIDCLPDGATVEKYVSKASRRTQD